MLETNKKARRQMNSEPFVILLYRNIRIRKAWPFICRRTGATTKCLRFEYCVSCAFEILGTNIGTNFYFQKSGRFFLRVWVFSLKIESYYPQRQYSTYA